MSSGIKLLVLHSLLPFSAKTNPFFFWNCQRHFQPSQLKPASSREENPEVQSFERA